MTLQGYAFSPCPEGVWNGVKGCYPFPFCFRHPSVWRRERPVGLSTASNNSEGESPITILGWVFSLLEILIVFLVLRRKFVCGRGSVSRTPMGRLQRSPRSPNWWEGLDHMPPPHWPYRSSASIFGPSGLQGRMWVRVWAHDNLPPNKISPPYPNKFGLAPRRLMAALAAWCLIGQRL